MSRSVLNHNDGITITIVVTSIRNKNLLATSRAQACNCKDRPATICGCHYIDGNVHSEKRMENVVDALKLLRLEGRVHLEWVSASEGPSLRRWLPSLSSRSGRWTPVRFGTRRNRRERESLGYRGRRQVVSPSGSCFLVVHTL